ncbi:hypothetical protein [Sporomusa termitida]|uniref:Uncharacterized protein n=1 Tax=Sporomusa termitida TaxID=2377 RepID=A0A517DVD9_9FIRM|nr:hypothetical protein [Sporomusa termitida]QDR81329.1 hypothetical protein SPTER_27080 [Sporomusa termitida]
MQPDKTVKTATAAGRKEARQTKEPAPFIPVQSAITLTKKVSILNKLKTLVRPYVQKYGKAGVLAIVLLAAILGKLLGVL